MKDTLAVIGYAKAQPRPRCRCEFCDRRRQELDLARRLIVEMPVALRRAIRKNQADSNATNGR
jgi:hypothetical protein